jgi:hypothetical protein
VVMSDEPIERSFRTGLKLGEEFGFVAPPRERTGPIGHSGLS